MAFTPRRVERVPMTPRFANPARMVYRSSAMPISHAPRERLDDEPAVITGGTGAIGTATARRLATLGARIVLLHRKPAAAAEPVLHSLAGGGHFAVTASVTDSASLAAAAREVNERAGAA